MSQYSDSMTHEYKQLFDQSTIPAWIFDNKTLAFLEVNKAACKRYGYTRDEFLKMTILDIRTTKGKMALKRHLQLDFAERNYVSQLWEHENKKGSIFFVEILCNNINYLGKEATYVQAPFANDKFLANVENRQLEQRLHAQQQQLDDILSSVNEVVWAINPADMSFLYTNNAFYHVLGYLPKEIVADKDLLINSIHRADLQRFKDAVMLAVTQGQSNCTFRIYHKNGTLKTLSGHAKLRPGKYGEPDMLSGISIDVTSQVKNETLLSEKIAQLQKAEQKLAMEKCALHALINNTPDLIWSVDRNNRIITANDLFVAANRARYNVDICPGYDMSTLQIPDDVYKRWEKYYTKGFEGHVFTVIEEEMVMGEKRYFKVNFNPIFDENNIVMGVSCFSSDVTEQRTRLIKMKLQNETLKEIADIQSHQVRGPLATMMGLAQLFNTSDLGDPENLQVLEKFHMAMNDLDQIIRQIDSKTKQQGISL